TKILKSNAFLELSMENIIQIIQRDDFEAPEIEIFQACVQWVHKECENLRLEKTIENQRKLLEHFLPYIRFSLISCQDLANTVFSSGLIENDFLLKLFIAKFSPSVMPTREQRRKSFKNYKKGISFNLDMNELL